MSLVKGSFGENERKNERSLVRVSPQGSVVLYSTLMYKSYCTSVAGYGSAAAGLFVSLLSTLLRAAIAGFCLSLNRKRKHCARAQASNCNHEGAPALGVGLHQNRRTTQTTAIVVAAHQVGSGQTHQGPTAVALATTPTRVHDCRAIIRLVGFTKQKSIVE